MARSSSKFRKYYERTYRALSRVELQRGMRPIDDFDLSELFDYDTDLWLGFYTEEGLRLALERYSITDDVRACGFETLEIKLSLDDPDAQMLRVWSTKPYFDEPLLELVVSRDVLHFQENDGQELARPFVPVLNIQWLLMQNPSTGFGPQRLPLPGQAHPGLGLGGRVMTLLQNTCRRLKLSGLVTVPSHFHNAMMYGQAFHYVDPGIEGVFRTLERDLLIRDNASPAHKNLAAASWALDWKMVVDDKSDTQPPSPFDWFHEAMVCPIDADLSSYFDAASYRAEVDSARDLHHFEIFERALRGNLESCGFVPWDSARAHAWLEKTSA